ncbi:uncharacterized protein DS421_1g03400 [Arachis hypogaea]|nr:uncharacterized protein DS421_1g03400 [Arachis hypogaea]
MLNEGGIRCFIKCLWLCGLGLGFGSDPIQLSLHFCDQDSPLEKQSIIRLRVHSDFGSFIPASKRLRMMKEVSGSYLNSLLTEVSSCYCNRFYPNKHDRSCCLQN